MCGAALRLDEGHVQGPLKGPRSPQANCAGCEQLRRLPCCKGWEMLGHGSRARHLPNHKTWFSETIPLMPLQGRGWHNLGIPLDAPGCWGQDLIRQRLVGMTVGNLLLLLPSDLGCAPLPLFCTLTCPQPLCIS